MTDIPTKQTLADALGRLMGSELSAVTFVRDYVQLAFVHSAYCHVRIRGFQSGATRLSGCTLQADRLQSRPHRRRRPAGVDRFREWSDGLNLFTRQRLSRPRSSGVLAGPKRSNLGRLNWRRLLLWSFASPGERLHRQTGTLITSKWWS